MKAFQNTKQLLLLLLSLCVLGSCGDRITPIGLSVDPRDKDFQTMSDSLDIEVRTRSIESVYSRSTYTLLGQINDPYFGSFRSSYACRMQTAPTFYFPHPPKNGRIDSVLLEINYASVVGDTTVWSKAVVYELQDVLPEKRFTGDLSAYTKGAKKVGELSYQAHYKGKDENHQLYVRLDKEIGERFYKASQEHPEYFATQKSFEERLLKGFYVKTTTGSGSILSIYNTTLVICYSYSTKEEVDGEMKEVDKPIALRFTNTNQLGLLQEFEHSEREKLLQENSKDFAYITSPQGLAMELTLSPKELQKIFPEQLAGAKKSRMINAAFLSLAVNVPPTEKTSLNPPFYTLLIPSDSLASFFQNRYTEQTHSRTCFLSSPYNINTRVYQYPNIGNLLSEHLKKNAKEDAQGRWIVEKPLSLVVLPVMREVQEGNTSVTEALVNLIYPSAARIQLKNGKLRLGVIASSTPALK